MSRPGSWRSPAQWSLIPLLFLIVSVAMLIGMVVFLALASPVAAQVAADSAVVVKDRLGIFGPVLDKFWPVIETALTSATLWVVARYTGLTKTWPAPAKWAALYFIALAYNLLAHRFGWAALDPEAPVFTLPLATGGAAAIVYWLGSHKVPEAAPARTSARPSMNGTGKP